MASHWYQSDGATKYTVPRSDGKGERDTNMRDARKLSLKPSVTTIIGMADKPGLVQYKLEQMVLACKDWPFEVENDDFSTWRTEVFRLSEQFAKESATRGNEIHDKLEQAVPWDMVDASDADFALLDPVLTLLRVEFGKQNWITEHSFCNLGFGGKIDLHSQDGDGVFIDFKTKNTDDIKKLKAYDEHAMQLAAYRYGMDKPKSKCYNLFISTKVPGLLVLHEWKEEEVLRGWEMFQCLKNYWQLKNNFFG